MPSFHKENAGNLIDELSGQRSQDEATPLNYQVIQFFNQLKTSINEEAALTIKSVFLGKVLESKTESGKAFRCAVFRVLNVCALLHMFGKGVEEWKV